MSEYRFDLSCKDCGLSRTNIGPHILVRVKQAHAKKCASNNLITHHYLLGPRIKVGTMLIEEKIDLKVLK